MSEGRVALVTGAGRGIGRAAALALAEAGLRVMAVARSEPELRSLADAAPVTWMARDLADEEGCRAVVEETRALLGPIAVLVNNAGIGSYHEQPIWAQTSDTWHESLAVNLHAPFHLTRLAVPDMRTAGFGRIVMVSSTAGEVGAPASSAYCTAKHGLLGLMRSVAQDVAPHGVTCNAVLPGWVRTRMADDHAAAESAEDDRSIEDVWAERAAGNPAGRVLEPPEIAAVIAFLCSPAASGVNGEALTVALGSVW